MTRRRNGQVLFALALLLGNTVYASQITKMALPFATGEPGPSFLPMVLCAFVYIAATGILIGELRSPAPDQAAAPPSEVVAHIRLVGPALAIGLTALFIIGFFYVGYLLSSAVYTFLIAFYFDVETTGRWKRSAGIGLVTALGVTAFGWLFFVELFGLYLPVWEL